MRTLRVLLTAPAMALIAGAASAGAPQAPRANPFAKASTLPFQAPPFDKITDADFKPALEEGMRLHMAEIRKIADNPAPPTFQNTIVAMERSGQMLSRVGMVFGCLTSANGDDTLLALQEEEAPQGLLVEGGLQQASHHRGVNQLHPAHDLVPGGVGPPVSLKMV